MKPLTASKARELIKQLNRMDLDQADYNYIKEQINRLFEGIPLRGITPHKEARLYRGVKHTERPLDVRKLGYPPSEKIKNYQRCNPPNKPMFYCSPDPAAVFYELNVKPGDNFYFSKWSVKSDFYILQIAPNVDEQINHNVRDIVLTFFETKFIQPIHETYSSQYKITSAIAERMSKGDLELNKGIEIGAISYPSVSHPARSENLAIRPEIVDTCLQLDYVEEITVKEVIGKKIEYSHTNFSARFSGGKIEWEDKPIHWTVPPGALMAFVAEPDGWVARDEKGNIVNPG